MPNFFAATDMNIATLNASMLRDLGLDDMNHSTLLRTRVTRIHNARTDEYDYMIRVPGQPQRTVTTRDIVDGREARQRARAEQGRNLYQSEMPGRVLALSNASQVQAEEGERIRQVAMQRLRESEMTQRIRFNADPWVMASPVEPELPPPPQRVPRWPSVRFYEGVDFTEQEVRGFMSEMNREIYSLLASDHQIAALVVKPPLIRAMKHHLRHEVFVRMEPARMPVGEYADVAIAPAAPTQRVISSESDMLLGYRLVADDAADPYWIVVKPRR